MKINPKDLTGTAILNSGIDSKKQTLSIDVYDKDDLTSIAVRFLNEFDKVCPNKDHEDGDWGELLAVFGHMNEQLKRKYE
jgi:hypothetical protein